MQGDTNHNMTDFSCYGNQSKRLFETQLIKFLIEGNILFRLLHKLI